MIDSYTYPEGIVVEEQTTRPPGYILTTRKQDDDAPHFSLDKVTFPGNGLIPYGKLVLFGTVKVDVTEENGKRTATIHLDGEWGDA